MHERRGPHGDWTDADEVHTTPGKRMTPEMAQRIARVRREQQAAVDAGAAEAPAAALFDLSDVRRR